MKFTKSPDSIAQQRRWMYGLMGIVLLFGVLLAWGTIRVFASRSGWLQAAIILACSLAYLALWGLVAWRRNADGLAGSDSQATMTGGPHTQPSRDVRATLGWSKSGWLSVLLAGSVSAVLLLLRSGAFRLAPVQVAQAVLGAIAVTGLAAVLAMIALSDPLPRPGRSLGLLAFVLAAINVALMIAVVVASKPS